MNEKKRNPYDPPRHIGRIVFYAVSTLIIVLLIAILFNVLITRKNGEPPSVFGFSVYIVTTDAMEDTMSEGDALLVRRVEPEKLQAGDVITFSEGYDREGKMLVNTRRIVEIRREDGKLAFQLQGDNRPAPDEALCGAEQVLGEAVSSMPGVGRFFAFVKTPLGLVACIALPLGILLVFEIINLVRLSRRSREEELLEGEEEAGQGPLALAVKRRQEAARGTLPPDQGDFFTESPPPMEHAFSVPVQTGSEPPPEEEAPPSRIPAPPWNPLADVMEKGSRTAVRDLCGVPLTPRTEKGIPEALLHIPVEPARVPLEPSGEPTEPVSYERPVAEPVPAPAVFKASTLEFQVKETGRMASASDVSVPRQPLSEEHTKSLHSLDATPVFAADVASRGRDRFQIDGIDVRVKPDSVSLALEEDREARDISITVTKDYTNVTVGSGGHEVNFALFRDEKDDSQKVIIQKKSARQPAEPKKD